MNPANIDDMKKMNRELTKARAEYAEAVDAAKRERGLAVIERRKPSKSVLDAPGKLSDTLAAIEVRAEQLPYELYIAEIKRREAEVFDANEKLTAVDSHTPQIEAEYEAKVQASNAATRKYRATLEKSDRALQEQAERDESRAREARRVHRSEILTAKTHAEVSTKRLKELEKTTPERYAA